MLNKIECDLTINESRILSRRVIKLDAAGSVGAIYDSGWSILITITLSLTPLTAMLSRARNN